MGEERTKRVAQRPKASDLRLGTDALIAEFGRRQKGRVTRQQLLAAGVSVAEIKHRLRTGRLHQVHPGVYAVGYPTNDMWARFQSAHLYAGGDSIVSSMAAAAGHGFGADPLVIDIICRRRIRSVRGIRTCHHTLEPWQVEHVNSLPVTSPAQTLFDLGSLLSDSALAKSANEAFVVTDLTNTELRAVQLANSRRKGSAAFATLLARIDPEAESAESGLEIRLHAFLRSRGFPPWESNVPLRIGTELIRPDALYRSQRVIIEADGRDPHLAPLRFESDRRRDRRCRVEGWEPVRVTSRDLGLGANELDADLRRLLGLEPRRRA